MAIDINIPSQVKNYANLAAFPATGTLKTIFIAEDTNKTYRWTGSAYVEISPAGASGITIGTTAITSGTVGGVLFEGTGNVVQESANLFWDNTNGRLGIGTSSPTNTFELASTSASPFKVATTQSYFRATFANSSSSGLLDFVSNFFSFPTNDVVFGSSSNSGSGRVFIKGAGATSATSSISIQNSASTELFRVRDNGNVQIATTTDAGFKLDVNGTARVSGVITTTTLQQDGGANTIVFAGGRIQLNASQVNIAYANTLRTINCNYGGTSGDGLSLIGLNFAPTNGVLVNGILLNPTISMATGANINVNIYASSPTINNAVVTNSNVRYIYYNPTVTNLNGANHYAFHSTSGRHRYENLPTSPTGLASGDLWNNLGILSIV